MKPETLGVARDDADVGGEHEVEARAHSAAADRGDGRGLELADAGERAVDHTEAGIHLRVRRIAPGRLQCAAIATGAEEAAGAANHHGPDLGIAVQLLAGGDELLRHRHRERVPPSGRIEAENRDAAVAPLDRYLRRHQGRDAT